MLIGKGTPQPPQKWMTRKPAEKTLGFCESSRSLGFGLNYLYRLHIYMHSKCTVYKWQPLGIQRSQPHICQQKHVV